MNADRATIEFRRAGLNAYREVHERWGDVVIVSTVDLKGRALLQVYGNEVRLDLFEQTMRTMH